MELQSTWVVEIEIGMNEKKNFPQKWKLNQILPLQHRIIDDTKAGKIQKNYYLRRPDDGNPEKHFNIYDMIDSCDSLKTKKKSKLFLCFLNILSQFSHTHDEYLQLRQIQKANGLFFSTISVW